MLVDSVGTPPTTGIVSHVNVPGVPHVYEFRSNGAMPLHIVAGNENEHTDGVGAMCISSNPIVMP